VQTPGDRGDDYRRRRPGEDMQSRAQGRIAKHKLKILSAEEDGSSQQCNAQPQSSKSLGASPARHVASNQSPYDPETPARNKGDGAEVDAGGRTMAFGETKKRQRRGHKTDGHVDPEDPVPVQPLDDCPSDERS
jgi:hypothetical protein